MTISRKNTNLTKTARESGNSSQEQPEMTKNVSIKNVSIKNVSIKNVSIKSVKKDSPFQYLVLITNLKDCKLIINTSLLTVSFPNVWKIAQVTPILKDGDHETPNNNRPISLLPVLSKVCERVAHNQFTAYLLSRNRLNSKQSGNKELHSTETSVIQTTDMILSAIDKKQLSAIVLLDMSKAFDSINHELLLAKLQDVGASPTVIQWFRSYLSFRYQVVRINIAISDRLQVVLCKRPAISTRILLHLMLCRRHETSDVLSTSGPAKCCN